MQVEALDGNLVRQVGDLVASMRAYNGYRSLWLDPFGMLWHGEPEDDGFEAMGHRYVGTFMHPDGDTLQAALSGISWPAVACLFVERRRTPRPLAFAAAM
jgi:hypothetical protein